MHEVWLWIFVAALAVGYIVYSVESVQRDRALDKRISDLEKTMNQLKRGNP